jgi:ADP-ribose pyrophosphatase
MAKLEQVTHTKQIYNGRVLNLRIDTIEMANGTVSEREIIEHGESVCIVAIDENDLVILVRQYRLAAGQQLLEIPAGSMEPDESPLESAKRELREETGRLANKWQNLGGYYAAPGYTAEYLHLFLARELTMGPDDQDEDEDVEVEAHPLNTIVALIVNGVICDAKSIAGLLQAIHGISTSK